MTGPTTYAFRRIRRDGRVLPWMGYIFVMDEWEVDPPGWEPDSNRRTSTDCCDIHVCPGCDAWQVEYNADGFIERDWDDEDRTESPWEAAHELAEQHRRECATFDFLAALSIET